MNQTPDKKSNPHWLEKVCFDFQKSVKDLGQDHTRIQDFIARCEEIVLESGYCAHQEGIYAIPSTFMSVPQLAQAWKMGQEASTLMDKMLAYNNC